jgi:hypothetical protein
MRLLDEVPTDVLEAEALAGEPDWVWAMIRFRTDGTIEVSHKIQRRRAVLFGALFCMWVAGTAGIVIGVVLGRWAH